MELGGDGLEPFSREEPCSNGPTELGGDGLEPFFSGGAAFNLGILLKILI